MGDSAEPVWVIGHGKFGRRAVDHLLDAAHGPANLTVIDSSAQDDVKDGVEYVQSDGVRWLVEHFHRQGEVRWVIPALPVHLAAQWIKSKLVARSKSVEALSAPEEIVRLLPNAYRLGDAEWAISHADFICPSDCMEPDEICTCTGLPRPQPLYDLLDSLPAADTVVLSIRSHQLAPGVGGLKADELWRLFDRVLEQEGRRLLLGTACKCHGIVSSFRFESQR
jgi:hypothetical protein